MEKTITLNWQESDMIKEILLDTLKDEILSNKSKFIIQNIISKLSDES
jgi:hypothetical protein